MFVPNSCPRSTRDVGLGDADDAVDVAGPDARADTRAAGDGVRRRDERIRAVVEIEERGLRPFQQHVLPSGKCLVNERDAVGDHRLDPGCQLVEVARGNGVRVEGEPVVDLGEDVVLLLEDHVELLTEDLRVEEVLHPQADPGRLVRVGRPDPPLGRAELVLPQEALGHAVELLVVRHDQVRVAADLQPAAVDSTPFEHVDLGDQHAGVDDHTVADERGDVPVEHAARHELQRERLAVHHDGVARVVAALVADDQLHLLGNEVGELALALVTPLRPHHDRRRHVARAYRRSSPITLG